MIWNLKWRAEQVRRQDLLGLDFGSSALKAVRLRRAKDQIQVVAAGVFPAVDLSGTAEKPVLPVLPDAFSSNYAAICVSHEKSALRILTLTGPGNPEEQIREQLGADSGIRCASVLLTPPAAKPPRFLAACLPQACIDACLRLFRAGAPAPCDLELSGLAALSACLHSLGAESAQAPLCAMEVGARSSFAFFLNRGAPVLIRKYDIGSDRFLARIEAELGIDRDTAIGVLEEGAIDLSSVFRDTLEFVARQIVISRDFVERQEKCRIGRILCSGLLSSIPSWRAMLRDTTDMEAESWNPFAALATAPGAAPEAFSGKETLFSGAVGAALGVMESR